MKLSILIVNYKSSNYIVDCLTSATQRLFDGNKYEWIIVDNASQDNSKDIITSQFPFVKWIALNENVGFARANNIAMDHATGNLILLLNPDTIIVEGTIEKTVDRFEKSHHAACGVQLTYPNGHPQFSGSYFVKGGLNHLLPIPYWGVCIKWLAHFLVKQKPAVVEASTEQLVDWISGAFLMVKKEIINQVGKMDEDFFLYAEEVEWCARIKKQGTLCIYGDLKLIHLIGTSIQAATNADDNSYTNLSDKKGLQLMVSNHLRIRKQYGLFWYCFQLLNYTWGVPFAWITSVLKHFINLKNPFKESKALMGYTLNVLTLWTLMPKMLSGRPYFYKML